jgi:hypothetical protein
MLHISKISQNKIHTDEWRQARLAHFTSSDAHRLMGDGFLTYVREKVGEEMTGIPARPEVDTEDTRWGLHYETDAVKKLCEKLSLKFIVMQCFVAHEGSRFGSTPDGILVKNISPDQDEYDVETCEVKCPPTYSNYIQLFECETPLDLKKANKKYYWQVLDQMDQCGARVGHFVAYHPDFKFGNFKHLPIAANYKYADAKAMGGYKFPIHEDLCELRRAKQQAEILFNALREKLMNAGKAA